MELETYSTSAIALRLSAVMLLVLANGFFVAAEFSLVGARRTRIDALARRGSVRARYAAEAVGRLDHYISGTQLGITLASLALGWIGETTIASILINLFSGLGAPWDVIASHVVAGTIAFLSITFLHIVIGELAPKSIALLFPEETSLATAAPLIWFSRLTAPFIAVLNGAANLLLRVFGLRAPTEMERVHRPEEIQMIVKQMHEHKQIGAEPVQMIRGVFHLSERTAADIMTPRTGIVALREEASLDEAEQRMLETGFSRLPVYRKSIDQIIGVTLALDIWRARAQGKQSLQQVIRRVPYVPDTKPLGDLLSEMRRANVHLVVVLDEFGGTHGIVTMEDIVEEVVGDIQDEDEPVGGRIRELATGTFEVMGDVPVVDLNESVGLDLPTDVAATVGGLVMARLGHVPTEGEIAEFRGAEIAVRHMDGRRITAVEIRRTAQDPLTGG